MATKSWVLPLTVNSAGTQNIGGILWDFDINDIAVPIVDDGTGTGSYMQYDNSGGAAPATNVMTYYVQESLATIASLGENLCVLHVSKRGTGASQTVYNPAEARVFFMDRLAGPIAPQGTGSKFWLRETNAPSSVYYEVTETPAAIVALLPSVGIGGTVSSTFIPYASSSNTLSDSWMKQETDGISLTATKLLRSSTSGETQVDFGSAGNRFIVTTDGGVQGESFIFMTPTVSQFGFNGESLTVAPGSLTAVHSAQIALTTPLISLSTGAVIESGTPGESSMTFGATDDSIFLSTDGAVQSESYLYLDPLTAQVSGLGGGLNISSGSAQLSGNFGLTLYGQDTIQLSGGNLQGLLFTMAVPSAPVNGSMWPLDGNASELIMKQSGVEKTLLASATVTTESVVSDTTVSVVIGGVTYKLLARA